MITDLLPGEIIVDNFAGGGGASVGIELALGRSPDEAANHDPVALAIHKANHPHTRHHCQDIWTVDPRKVAAGRKIGLAWFSPDCSHHSKAKGSKPVEKGIRDLAWVVCKWAAQVAPRIIILENVEEFQDWGPLDENNKPIKSRKGETFRRWLGRLRSLGYQVEYRELKASDYGVPTSRKRLYLVARNDGKAIVWPEPTHGPGKEPYRTAAQCIDFSLPSLSIFATKEEARAWARVHRKRPPKRPLVENTLRRTARGLFKFVLNCASPFVIAIGQTGFGDSGRVRSINDTLSTIVTKAEHCLITPVLAELAHKDKLGQARRVLDIQQPVTTQHAGGGKFALVTAFIEKFYGGVVGQTPDNPLGTITTIDHHALATVHIQRDFLNGTGGNCAEPMPTIMPGGAGGKCGIVTTVLKGAQDRSTQVSAFLVKYFGTGGAISLLDPIDTITTKDRFGLVYAFGIPFQIMDICLRMLEPKELLLCQGFPETYKINIPDPAKPHKFITKEAQVKMIGNSVCPPMAAALVAANVSSQAIMQGPSMKEWHPGLVKSGEQMPLFDLAGAWA